MTEETTPVFVMGDGEVLYGKEQFKAFMERQFAKVITIMGEEMHRQGGG